MLEHPIPSDERREVHLLDYWRTIWRGRWTILSIFVIVLTLVAIGTFTQTPIYRARATVEIAPQARQVTPVAEFAEMGAGSYGWFAEERYFNTQYEIIKSRDVASRVFERTDLYNHPSFKKSSDPVGQFSRMIQVAPVRETGIVEISLEGSDPEEVATWVNTTAEAYVDRNLELATQAATTAVQSLMSEIKPLRERLEDTQRETYEFAEKQNLYVPGNQLKITTDNLSTLQTELTQTQAKERETESILRQIESISATGRSYETIPAISSDPVIQDLSSQKADLDREYERLLVTYKEKHVRVLEQQSGIEKVNQKIDAEVQRIISNLRSQLALQREGKRKLTEAINEARAESLRVDRSAAGFEVVRGEATETRRIYDLISTRVKEITLSSSLMSNNLQILDKAPVPTVPIKPRTLLNLAFGAVLGLLLGIGTVFFLDYLDNTIRSAEDIEHFLKMNLLAIVPKETESTRKAVNEAFQTLRTSLLFSRKSNDANALLITSAGPQEGKSCTTISLARTLAKGGEKTVVIDCDLRRPTIHQRLELSRDRGVTNYILSSDGDDWRNYVKPTNQPNLFAITCGPIPPNPADVFGHERFKTLLTELRQQFDWVFIHSPPVISLADATILASLADMVAFVIRHNENDKDLIKRCVGNLRKVNPAVIGAVLNDVDFGKSHFRDYYYMGYYYYGESSTAKGRKSKSGAVVSRRDGSDPDEKFTRSVG